MPIMKIGLLGLGFMGKQHLDAYAQIHGVEILTRNHVIFSHIDSRNSVALVEAMLADREISAIDICLPTRYHKEIAIAALDAGKHVLCEKPMALSPEDCAAMIAAAERNQRILMIAHVLRFWPAYRQLREILGSHQFGPVRRAKFSRRCSTPNWGEWFQNPALTGGATLDLLIHDIDQALLLFGSPESASGMQLTAPDAASYSLNYADGLVVEIEGGWFPATELFAMSFQVETETAEIALESNVFSIKEEGAAPQPIELSAEDAYAVQLSYFVGSCRSNQPVSACTPESSAQAVQLACLLRDLAKSGGFDRQVINLRNGNST
jgi:predicted dehydrogenase